MWVNNHFLGVAHTHTHTSPDDLRRWREGKGGDLRRSDGPKEGCDPCHLCLSRICIIIVIIIIIIIIIIIVIIIIIIINIMFIIII